MIALGANLLIACAPLTAQPEVVPPTAQPTEPLPAASAPASATVAPTESAVEAEPAPAHVNRRISEFDAYVPPQLLPLDGIRPVYEPRFVSAADSPLQDDELVIGVAWEGEAKAYPITVLRFREMVNDELAGIPTLVTW